MQAHGRRMRNTQPARALGSHRPYHCVRTVAGPGSSTTEPVVPPSQRASAEVHVSVRHAALRSAAILSTSRRLGYIANGLGERRRAVPRCACRESRKPLLANSLAASWRRSAATVVRGFSCGPGRLLGIDYRPSPRDAAAGGPDAFLTLLLSGHGRGSGGVSANGLLGAGFGFRW